MTNLKYYEGYTEVLEVLKYVSIDNYNKIPKKFITYMEENCSENYDFKYNIALPFEKQGLSEVAKNILAMIYRLFWADEEKKKELSEKDKLDMINEELEKQRKYNPDNLFDNRKNDSNEKIVNDELAFPVVIKEKWYIKVFKKIKGFFKR